MPKKMMSLMAASAAVVAVSGCEKTLDTASIEPSIKETMEKSGAQVESVKCPDDVTAKKGDNFTCDVKLAGGRTATVDVTQTDDKGKVTFVPKLDTK